MLITLGKDRIYYFFSYPDMSYPISEIDPEDILNLSLQSELFLCCSFSVFLQHNAVLLQGRHGITAFIVQPVIIPLCVRGQQVKESPGWHVCVPACFSLLELTSGR